MNTNVLLIERPELQSTQQRAVFGILTLVMWAIWFYLWLPLITLVGWYLGFDLFADYILNLREDEQWRDLLLYGVVIVLSGMGLFLWSQYNLSRFSGLDRRAGAGKVENRALCKRFKIDSGVLMLMQHGKTVRICLDQKGSIKRVDDLSFYTHRN